MGASNHTTKELVAIARSKGSARGDAELQRMTKAQLWKEIYAVEAARKAEVAARPRLQTIHFTGFRAARKAELEKLAHGAGWKVVTAPNGNLALLCVGETPGAMKLDFARKHRITVMREPEFLRQIR